MAEGVYVLCALTSIVCAGLLFRGYRLSRTRLLFWSSLCFVALAVNNVMLLVDFVVVPDGNFGPLRGGIALLGLLVLLHGLIQESR
ncbi:MAG TPA: DUF5985 family protein [Steroidobacteraceae bacterium]|nr:DUF5985 family protein [Steroidobacteraceae bacterium]